jgi:hypothetical protein
MLQDMSCIQIVNINDTSDCVKGWTNGKRGSLTGGGKSSLQTSRPALGPTQPAIQSVPGGAFPGDYAARACSLLLTSSSVEVRNECSTSSVYLYGLHKNNFTFAVIGMMRNKTKKKR